MKVLMINSVCGIRSTGRICTDIAEELERQGHEVKIAYGRETVPEKYRKYAVRIGTDLDVKLHGLKTRLLDRHGFGSARATKKFIKWVKEFDPDVIHLHNLHGYYINVKVLFDYLRTCGKKIIWTLHDCWAFTGHCSHFDYIGCDRWKNGCKSCPNKREYPKSIFLDNSKNSYNLKKNSFTGIENLTIVTPSKWLKNLVRESFLSQYEIKCIYNGIDTNIFKPTNSDIKKRYDLDDKRVVLAVSSVWNTKKGYHDILALSRMLPDAYRIVIVGISEKQAKELPENIVGICRTNNTKELAELYTCAEVFVNPTYEDTYPTVNLEAQACGTPVITYKTGGSVESVPVLNQVDRGDLCTLKKIIVTSTYSYEMNANTTLKIETFVKEYIGVYGFS